jgi:hypothetical protein
MKFVTMFMIYFHTISPRPNGSLIITIKPKAKYDFMKLPHCCFTLNLKINLP